MDVRFTADPNVSLKRGKPLSDKALDIIERWSKKKNPDSEYVFPILIRVSSETRNR